MAAYGTGLYGVGLYGVGGIEDAFVATTTEYWSATGPDGVDYALNTYAFNIESWGNSRQAPPPVRGSNVLIPFKPGQLYVPKMPDSRTITLAMWVSGANQDGSITPLQVQNYHNNWALLKFILWNRLGQFKLTKRWIDASGTLQTATAMAEYSSGLDLTSNGASRGSFTVDLLLADPFFYGAAVTIPFNTASTGTVSTTIKGDYYSRKITLAAAANPTTNTLSLPRIDVSTTPTPNYWYLNDTIPVSTALAVDFDAQAATLGTAMNVSNLVSHSGYPSWLLLNPGACTIVFSSTTNNWSGSLIYIPTYW